MSCNKHFLCGLCISLCGLCIKLLTFVPEFRLLLKASRYRYSCTEAF